VAQADHQVQVEVQAQVDLVVLQDHQVQVEVQAQVDLVVLQDHQVHLVAQVQVEAQDQVEQAVPQEQVDLVDHPDLAV
jgi:hypothetical protein